MIKAERAPRLEKRSRVEATLPELPGYSVLETLSSVGELFVKSGRAFFTPPFSWFPEFITELATAFRRAMVPLVLAATFLSLGIVAVFFGNVVQLLGTMERMGGGDALGFWREANRWLTMMIVPGVVATSITADLGSRAIRGELEALSVLGVDHVRSLALPRILVLAIAMPIMGLITVAVCNTVAFVAAALVQADILQAASYIEVVWKFQYGPDMLGFLIQMFFSGLIVGTVAVSKGLQTRGGTDAVGRAVNETVLVSFTSVWIIHTLFAFAMISLFPTVLEFRG